MNTIGTFTKPVDPVVGEYIEQWENVRNTQPLQEDPKTGERVHFSLCTEENGSTDAT